MPLVCITLAVMNRVTKTNLNISEMLMLHLVHMIYNIR